MPPQPSPPLALLATGDLIIDELDPDRYFELARATLQAADIVVGHVEVPFEWSGDEVLIY